MTRIAIIGGHGKVALELSRILAAEGEDVTSFFRNPDHTEDVAATGATPSVLDVENSTTAELAGALRGHDAVVWSAGAGGGNPDRTYAVDRDAAIRSMDAAAEAGVGRYVMVSYFGAGPDHGVPADNSFHAYAEAKAAADQYLRGTGPGLDHPGPRVPDRRPGNGLIDVDPADTSARHRHLARQRGPRDGGRPGLAGNRRPHHRIPGRHPACRRGAGARHLSRGVTPQPAPDIVEEAPAHPTGAAPPLRGK